MIIGIEEMYSKGKVGGDLFDCWGGLSTTIEVGERGRGKQTIWRGFPWVSFEDSLHPRLGLRRPPGLARCWKNGGESRWT